MTDEAGSRQVAWGVFNEIGGELNLCYLTKSEHHARIYAAHYYLVKPLFLAPEWMPIETAPKDDEVLLATDNRVADGFPQVVYWDTEENNGWHTVDSDLRYHPEFFTHWRRDCLVPPTPKEKA